MKTVEMFLSIYVGVHFLTTSPLVLSSDNEEEGKQRRGMQKVFYQYSVCHFFEVEVRWK